MKKIILIGTTLLSLVGFSSCEKASELNIDVSDYEYLYRRSWNITDIVYTSNVDAEIVNWVNTYNQLKECQKDDYFHFDEKSHGFHHDYFVRCNYDSDESTQFWWNITNNNYIKCYTNPDNVDQSLILVGEIKKIAMNKFTVTHKFFNDKTELNECFIYTVEEVFPTDL